MPLTTNDLTATAFAARLNNALARHGLSQSQLAQAIGVSRSTITGWLRYGKLPDAYLIHKLCVELGCSADWLLGLDTVIEKRDPLGRIGWIEQMPPFISDPQREQIAYGIRLFNSFVMENRSADEAKAAHNWQAVPFALQAAFRSGAIRLINVARNGDQEQALLKCYPTLKEVVVADVPQNFDDTIIRTELVCFLAATQVLSQIVRPAVVGLGSGYTMLRLCENSIPSIDQFTGTNWVPLLAFSAANATDYTANYLARLMSIRHPGSHAQVLPHPDETVSPDLSAAYQHTVAMVQNAQTIFVSVSGVDRRNRSGSAHVLAEFRSADYLAEAPELRSTYVQLENKQDFGAELLRYLLDTNGSIISRDPAVAAQVDLEILRYNSTVIGKVCIVAARSYKAKAILTCLRSNLANALVIDSEIAEYLIENA